MFVWIIKMHIIIFVINFLPITFLKTLVLVGYWFNENLLQLIILFYQSKLAALEDIDEHLISLYSQGEPLNDNQIVGELNNFNIDFIVPLLGGNIIILFNQPSMKTNIHVEINHSYLQAKFTVL